jgi:hypothetical protein
MSADTLFFLWCDTPKREALLRMFPGRTVWEYEYPGRLTAYSGSESGAPAAAAPAHPEAKADRLAEHGDETGSQSVRVLSVNIAQMQPQ